ncbi:MAG: DUF89 family protein [Staphylothermus sp.]|nr:DUF89 family protein [Staphylothermus sp.]
MRVKPLCVQCIIDSRFREIRGTNTGDDAKIYAGIELLRIGFEEFKRGGELTVLATRIYHRLLESFPAIIEYYKKVKRESIEEAYSYLPVIEDYLEKLSGYDKYVAATKISIIGNYLDTGVMEHNPPSVNELLNYIDRPLAIDYTREFYELVSNGGKKIIWLFDNAGEAILDIPLIKILRNMGNKVIGVVKEDPGFQNDLTISDALEAGLDSYVDELLSTSYPGSSIHWDKISDNAKAKIKEADLIVAKGMAHWEYIIEIDLGKPIYHLLVPKCSVIAEALGVPRGTLVALLNIK